MPWELWVLVAMLVGGIPLAYSMGKTVGREEAIYQERRTQ